MDTHPQGAAWWGAADTGTHIHTLTAPRQGPLSSPGRETSAQSPRALCLGLSSVSSVSHAEPQVSSAKWGYGFTLQNSSWNTRDKICEVGNSIRTSQMSNLGPVNLITIKIQNHTHMRRKSERGGPGEWRAAHIPARAVSPFVILLL